MTPRCGRIVALLLAAVLFTGCAAPPPPADPGPRFQFSPSRQYAAQVLAYLMKVVLGRAGPADLRAEWARRGLDAPLDFQRISRIMLEPGQNRTELVVFDTRILGVSAVLYAYDPGLNLFKGKGQTQSLFPSVELIALRTLLLQKLHRGETIRLEQLHRRRRLLSDPRLPATPQDLEQTGLTAVELGLLQEVLSSDPHLQFYLFHPALVAALVEIGAALPDPFVSRMLSARRRQRPVCSFPDVDKDPPVVRIALLPSVVAGFEADAAGDAPGGPHLRSGEKYRRAVRRLQERILEAAEAYSFPQAQPRSRIVFSAPVQRPLVIVPENAAAAVGRFCPDADYTLILLGKDVIRSFEAAPPGIRPGYLFIDIADIERSWIEAELDIVGRFAASRFGRVTD